MALASLKTLCSPANPPYFMLPALSGATASAVAAALLVFQAGFATATLTTLTTHIGFSGALITYLAVPATVVILGTLIIQKIVPPLSACRPSESPEGIKMTSFTPLNRIATRVNQLTPDQKQARETELLNQLTLLLDRLGKDHLIQYQIAETSTCTLGAKEMQDESRWIVLNRQFTHLLNYQYPAARAYWEIRIPLDFDSADKKINLSSLKLANATPNERLELGKKVSPKLQALVSKHSLTICELALLGNVELSDVEKWLESVTPREA